MQKAQLYTRKPELLFSPQAHPTVKALSLSTKSCIRVTPIFAWTTMTHWTYLQIYKMLNFNKLTIGNHGDKLISYSFVIIWSVSTFWILSICKRNCRCGMRALDHSKGTSCYCVQQSFNKDLQKSWHFKILASEWTQMKKMQLHFC